jgi:hypothetical protein
MVLVEQDGDSSRETPRMPGDWDWIERDANERREGFRREADLRLLARRLMIRVFITAIVAFTCGYLLGGGYV